MGRVILSILVVVLFVLSAVVYLQSTERWLEFDEESRKDLPRLLLFDFNLKRFSGTKMTSQVMGSRAKMNANNTLEVWDVVARDLRVHDSPKTIRSNFARATFTGRGLADLSAETLETIHFKDDVKGESRDYLIISDESIYDHQHQTLKSSLPSLVVHNVKTMKMNSSDGFFFEMVKDELSMFGTVAGEFVRIE